MLTGSQVALTRNMPPFDLEDLTAGLWLRASEGVWLDIGKTNPVVSDGQTVAAWADRSGNGFDGLQSTSGSRPAWKTNLTSFGGEPAVRFQGSHWLDLTGISIPSGEWTIFVVAQPLDAGTEQRVFDTATGRLYVSLNAATCYNDGSGQGTEINGLGAQVYTWDLSVASGGQVWANQISLPVGDPNYTARAFGGSTAIGANNTGSGSYASLDLAELIVCPRLDSLTRVRVQSLLRDRYSLRGPYLETRSVLTLGDSLTDGGAVTTPWPTRLRTVWLYPEVVGSVTVTNGAVDGGQSDNAVTQYASLGGGRSDVVIWAGLNDIRLGSGGEATSTWANLENIIADALAANQHVILCTISPFYGDVAHGGWTQAKQDDVDALNTSIRAKTGVTLVDLNLLLRDPNEIRQLLPAYEKPVPDHVHINQTATNLVADTIYQAIRG